MAKTVIKLYLTDEVYRSIGHVAAQWAYLETELDQMLSDFMSRKKVRKLKLSNKKSFKNRIKNLRKAADALLKKRKKELKEFKIILKDVSSLKARRDDVIHGRWKLKKKGVDLLPGAVVIRTFPSYEYKGIMLASRKAEDVAGKISRVTLRAAEWRNKYSG